MSLAPCQALGSWIRRPKLTKRQWAFLTLIDVVVLHVRPHVLQGSQPCSRADINRLDSACQIEPRLGYTVETLQVRVLPRDGLNRDLFD